MAKNMNSRQISLAGFALLICALNVGAVEVGDLYTTSVAWQAGESRNPAYRRALQAVLVKVTGNPSAASDPAIVGLFGNPGRLVLGYQAGSADSLLVSFDGRQINDILRAADQPVWSVDRPLTLVWLAVDKGRGERKILSASDRSVNMLSARRADPADFLRERVRNIAAKRGIPVAFPLMDAEDQSNVSVADIQGGFTDPVIAASRRYGAGSILIGRVNAAQIDRIQWQWVFGADTMNFTGSVERAGGRVANRMASLFALSDSTNTVVADIVVSGIDDAAGYGRVLGYLSGLPQVKSVAVESVENGQTAFSLELLGGLARLQDALASTDFLEAEERFSASQGPLNQSSLQLRYRP